MTCALTFSTRADDTGHIGGDLFVAVQEVLQVDIGAQVVGTEVHGSHERPCRLVVAALSLER